MKRYSFLGLVLVSIVSLNLYAKPVSSATDVVVTAENSSHSDWARISSRLKSLPVADYSTTAKCEGDWLIDPSRFKAGVWAGEDGKSIVISNGLVARVFRLTPNLATVDIINQMMGYQTDKQNAQSDDLGEYVACCKLRGRVGNQRQALAPGRS